MQRQIETYQRHPNRGYQFKQPNSQTHPADKPAPLDHPFLKVFATQNINQKNAPFRDVSFVGPSIGENSAWGNRLGRWIGAQRRPRHTQEGGYKHFETAGLQPGAMESKGVRLEHTHPSWKSDFFCCQIFTCPKWCCSADQFVLFTVKHHSQQINQSLLTFSGRVSSDARSLWGKGCGSFHIATMAKTRRSKCSTLLFLNVRYTLSLTLLETKTGSSIQGLLSFMTSHARGSN